MMTDREMLEFAAKAVGVTHVGYSECACGDMYHPRDGEAGLRISFDVRVTNPQIFDGSGAWNPLINDGDALRLAVQLRMRVEPWGSGASSVASVDNLALVAEPHYGDDPERATRRAIVRAAAQIGKEMP